MPVTRRIVESPMYQGEREVVVYTLDVSRWGDNPTNASVNVYQGSTGSWADVTATVTAGGSTTCDGNLVTFLPILNIKEAEAYHCIVTFTLNGGTGNTLSPWWDIIGEK